MSLDNILTKLDEAGFRPATFEEVAAVRGKLVTILKDEHVMVCETKATMNKKDYYLCCSFDYVLGTDILTRPPGRFGLVTSEWKTSILSVVLAAVKK